MRVRKLTTGVAAAAVTATVLAITGGPASAAASNPDPDDTTYQPGTAADLVGVGSDTSQHVVADLANAYDATNPASKLVSWSATGGGSGSATPGTITLRDGTQFNRPVGSSAGISLLHGTNINANIDFARSSRAITDANGANEITDGLQMFPFAVDTLIMETSGLVATHAPASVSPAQLVQIYTGSVTDWSQLGGTAGAIHPLIPQSGSGTRNFFLAQLQAANNNTPITLGADVQTVTEHDPAPIQNDPAAIAPFSLAKSIPVGDAIHQEPGLSADRAIYNVVKSAAAASSPAVQAAFGPTGYFCSAAAKNIIVQDGFRQLLPDTQGGVCGDVTQSPTSNLAAGSVPTSTTVSVTSASSSSAKIVATVASTPAPYGRVSFYEGSTLLKSGVRLTSSQATLVQTAAPGSHTYTAVFTQISGTAFTGSQGTGTGVVQKSASSLKAKFPKKVTVGKKVKGKVTVKLADSAAKATGKILVKEGKKTVGKGTLKNGVAKITLSKLKKIGKYKLVVMWSGDANGSGSKKKVKISIVAPKK